MIAGHVRSQAIGRATAGPVHPLCIHPDHLFLDPVPRLCGVPHRRSAYLQRPFDLNQSTMPLKLISAEPLPPFTFSPPPPSPPSDALAPRPPADFLPERDMTMFGPSPLHSQGEEGRGLVRCLRCGRVNMEWAAAEHKRKSGDLASGPSGHQEVLGKAKRSGRRDK